MGQLKSTLSSLNDQRYMSRQMYFICKKQCLHVGKTPFFAPRSYISARGTEALLFCTLLLSISYLNEDRR